MHGLGVGVCGVCVAASFILTTRAVRRSLETLDSLPEAGPVHPHRWAWTACRRRMEAGPAHPHRWASGWAGRRR